MVGAVLPVPHASLVATHAPGSITLHCALFLVLQVVVNWFVLVLLLLLQLLLLLLLLLSLHA